MMRRWMLMMLRMIMMIERHSLERIPPPRPVMLHNCYAPGHR